jgi:hypothetical protein
MFQQKQQQQGEEEHSVQHGSETSSFLREKVLGFEIRILTYRFLTEVFLLTRFHTGSLWVPLGGDHFLGPQY